MHRFPTELQTPTQVQRLRGGQSSWERGVRTLLGNLAQQRSAKERKSWKMGEAKNFGWGLLCCWGLATPLSQNSTEGTEPSRPCESHSSLGCRAWGYGCIGTFVLRWGWQGQKCSPPGWLVGNDPGQGSSKPQLLHNRAEGIPQRQTGAGL